MSGLAVINPCDASSISLSTLLEKEAVNIPILDALVRLHMPVTMDDLSFALCILPEECGNLFSHMLTHFENLSEKEPSVPPHSKNLALSNLLHRSLMLMKLAFATILMKNGAKPLRETTVLVVNDKSLNDPGLIKLLAQECSPENRATMLVQALISNQQQTSVEVLQSGPINAGQVNLAEVMTSNLLAKDVSYVGRSVAHVCMHI